jgi:hypothetical protein
MNETRSIFACVSYEAYYSGKNGFGKESALTCTVIEWARKKSKGLNTSKSFAVTHNRSNTRYEYGTNSESGVL